MKKYLNTLCLGVVILISMAGLSNAVPPKVIKTIPQNGEQNVDPALKLIRIEFNQDMNGDGFSICGGGPNFPELLGKPRWLNKRTLIAGVKLKPNYEYQMSINCPSYQNCKNVNGEPAEIYPVNFKTAPAAQDTNNNPSKSPAILLQEGIYAEQTEGNLDKAMDIYGQIREKYNDVERVSAGATYQLGLCNLKKGDSKKAAELFQEVVSYYPDQADTVKMAQQQLEKIDIPKTAHSSIFEKLGPVSAYIGLKYGQISAEEAPKIKGYSNCQIALVDNDFVSYIGGMGYVYNDSNQPIKNQYQFGSTTTADMRLYDVTGNPLDAEILPDPDRTGYYNMFWNPKEPVQPGTFFYYGWDSSSYKTLSQTKNANGYPLTIQNRFGGHCYETFFLVVPQGTILASKSEDFTGKNTLNGFDIYWWGKELPGNTEHRVSVVLRKEKIISSDDRTQAISLISAGWELFRESDYAEAEKMFQKAVDLDPYNDGGFQGLGWAEFNQGKKEIAKDTFKKCIELNPKNPAALNGLGWAAYSQNDPNKAIEWWQKAVESTPQATASLSGLTKVYMDKGDYQNAAKYYEIWLNADPNNATAKKGLQDAKEKLSPK